MTYSLPRDGEPHLAFEGELLAKATSALGSKRRWTELAIYRTEGGSYVVQTIARSSQAGEVDWWSARAFDTATQAIEGMRDRRRQTLSKLALELLEEAAGNDEDLSTALTDVEDSVENIR